MTLTVTHFIRDLNPATGGPVSALANMVRCQTEAGLRVRIATPTSLQTNLGDYSDFPTGQSAEENSPSTDGPRSSPDVLVRKSDVIHLHGVWEPIIRNALAAAKKSGTPIVWTPHGMLTRWAMNQSRLKKHAYHRLLFRRHLPPSTVQHFASTAERDATVPCTRLAHGEVVPLGIDTNHFATQRDPDYLQRVHQINGPSVLFVGRIHPGKGVEHLIAAAWHLPPEACTFVIAGPHYSDWAQNQIQAATRLPVRFVFTGPLAPRDVAFALSSTTVYCLPSDHENFGMAAAEALAAGTPSLLSREVAIAAGAVDANAAAFCRRDPAGLAEDLADALSKPNRLDSLGSKASAYAAKHFAIDVTAQRWRSLYESLTGHEATHPTDATRA